MQLLKVSCEVLGAGWDSQDEHVQKSAGPSGRGEWSLGEMNARKAELCA